MYPTLTRRHFFSTSAMAAAVLFSHRPARAASRGPYIDVHTHITQAWGTKKALNVADLLRWMDANNVEQAVVMPLVAPESWDHPISTDYVLSETKPHRDRLIPFCVIDPRTEVLGDDFKTKLEMLLRYKDAGAKGFGEHKPGVPMNHPRNKTLFRACADAELPVLFHIDNIRNMDKPGLPGLEEALKEVPNAVFIGHAPGFWANISGDATQDDMNGYPKTPVTPGGALDRLLDAYPNLFCDLSAGSGNGAIDRDHKFGREFIIRRADRLLFGTDYLEPGQAVGQFELLASLHLPEDVERKVYRENARRLLHL